MLYQAYCEIVPLPAFAVTLRLFVAIFKHVSTSALETWEVIVGDCLIIVLIEVKDEELKLTVLFVE